jgi:PRTRC genetic system ThiF family protein
MNTVIKSVHFTDKYILQPTNPVTVNLIGAGGTGGQMLTALARINHALKALGHPTLQVKVFDDDVVTTANLGRQLFAQSELGLNKGVALINRINRFFGTNWKAVPMRYAMQGVKEKDVQANITLSCVDTIQSRFDIATVLRNLDLKNHRDRPTYWMDFGNSYNTGQVILSTVRDVEQPASKKFRTVAKLRFITDEFKGLLMQQDDKSEPSCSLAEALDKQDLFINSAIANCGASLLWRLFRKGMTENRGFFLNLDAFRTEPLKVA